MRRSSDVHQIALRRPVRMGWSCPPTVLSPPSRRRTHWPTKSDVTLSASARPADRGVCDRADRHREAVGRDPDALWSPSSWRTRRVAHPHRPSATRWASPLQQPLTATSTQTSLTCLSRIPLPVEVARVWLTRPDPQAGAFADFARGYFTNSSTPAPRRCCSPIRDDAAANAMIESRLRRSSTALRSG